MTHPEVRDGQPRFGMGFKIVVGGAALLSGVALLLWASGFSEPWQYLPSLFCFALFGIFALPRPLAIACGYIVAGSILGLCAWYLYLGFTDKAPLAPALHIAAIYGVPALAYILYRQIPGEDNRDT